MDGSLLTNLFTNELTMDLIAQAQTGAGAVGSNISGSQYLAVAIAAVVLILPFWLGGFFAKKFRMPTYGTRFGWVLLCTICDEGAERPRRGLAGYEGARRGPSRSGKSRPRRGMFRKGSSDQEQAKVYK